MNAITKTEVTEDQRLGFLPEKAGIAFLSFENYVYNIASRYTDYNGGMWQFWNLDNEGFFMSPDTDIDFHFQNPENYSDVRLSSEALGIVVCLYAFSHMSFTYPELGDYYHQLAEFVGDHPEASAIWEAVD